LRDNILVGINRFDQLSGGPPERPEVVREDDLQATAPVLHAALVSADNLTLYRDRVVLLCALSALEGLAGAGRATASDRFRSNASATLADWNARTRQSWHRVAEKLFEVQKTRSVLAGQLREVVADGGLGRLKALLVDHVAQHGLRQLFDRVHELSRRLQRAYQELPRRSAVEQSSQRLSVEAVKEHVRKLHQEYALVQREFRAGVSSGLKVRDTHGDGERPVEEVAAAQVCKHVWDWPVWNRLLNRIEQGKFRHTSGSIWRLNQRTEIPANSLAFLEDFRDTLKECWDSIQESVKAAVPNLLASLAARARARAGPLTPLLTDRQVEQRVARLRGRPGRSSPQELLEWLRYAANPACKEVQEQVLKSGATDALASEPWSAERYYPLAGTKGDDYPQALAWSTTADTPESYNDQFLLARLRNQLVKGARYPVLKRVQELNHRVFSVLDEFFVTCVEQLEQVLVTPALLHALAGDSAADSGWRPEEVPWPFPGKAEG
jgi:hypothetical protein